MLLLLALFVVNTLSFELIQPLAPRDNVFRSSLVYYTEGSKEYILSHGGQVGNGEPNDTRSDVWRFSIVESRWEKLPTNGAPYLTDHYGFWRNITDSILFCGGYTPKSENIAIEANWKLYEYFITNNSWSFTIQPTAPLNNVYGVHYIEETDTILTLGRRYHTLVSFKQGSHDYNILCSYMPNSLMETAIDGLIYFKEIETAFISGGTNTNFSDSITVFTSPQFSKINISKEESPTWQVDSLPTSLATHIMHGAYPYVYIWGGCTKFEFSFSNAITCLNVSSTLYIYNVETNEWNSTETSLALRRSSSVITPDAIYVYGGIKLGEEYDYNLYRLDLVNKPDNINPNSTLTPLLTKAPSFPITIAMLLTVATLFAFSILLLFFLLHKLKPSHNPSTIPLTSFSK